MSAGLTPRELLALWLAKAARRTLRLLGRGGTNFPGELAVKIAPELLGKLARGVDIAAVSGTNGKTTCCRVLAQAYADAGIPCLANRSGANLLAGITAEFAAAARLSGVPKYRKAVIECDEAAAKTVFRLLQPRVILYTNVFRDQLDRYGEVTHTLENLRFAASQAPDAVLCLNADDSLLASLADALPNETRFYGVDAALPGAEAADELSDARFCIRCRTPYEYDRRTYAHLGAYRCPQCGYRRPEPDVAVTAASPDAEGSDLTLRIGDAEISARFPLPAAYNIYNAAASAAALSALGFAPAAIRAALEGASCGFGRLERFALGGGVQMILVKNPAGFNQVLRYLGTRTEPFRLCLALNDRAADGTDISWIWDVDFESLAGLQDRIAELILSGTRAEELLLRLKYAGLDVSAARLERDGAALTALLAAGDTPAVVVPTYTAMMALRPHLAKAAGKGEFWE